MSRPTPARHEAVMAALLRQTGNRPSPLSDWLVRRENAYYDGAGQHWDRGLICYAAARDAVCWQLRRTESEAWQLLEASVRNPERTTQQLNTSLPPPATQPITNHNTSAVDFPEAETTSKAYLADVPTVEIPLRAIKLSKDVPNFKRGADPDTGIVPGQELKGDYKRVGTGAIVVWVRLNDNIEALTGRHRKHLAVRCGEKTIPAQVVYEALGFTREMAVKLAAEANIRDGQGITEDYAHYFKHSRQLTGEQADADGLLARPKGKAGWDLARNASENVYAAWVNVRLHPTGWQETQWEILFDILGPPRLNTL
jgi:hypothetical protein